MINIAILIPVFNRLEYTQECLRNLEITILQHEAIRKFYTVIVVDDASSDGTSGWIANNYPQVHLIQGNGDLWWSGGINRGAEYAIEKLDCSHVLLWNNDIEVDSKYFQRLLSLAELHRKDTLVGSKIYGNIEKRLVWSMGGKFNPRTGKSFMIGYLCEDNTELNQLIEADWLTGMGSLVPTEVIRKIGYWDEKNFPQYIGDMEFTYRAKKNGFRVIVDPGLIILNDTSSTGLLHQGSWKKLMKMFTDKRSLYNVSINIRFYRLYTTSIFAYFHLLGEYLKLVGGFFKWKILHLLGFKRKVSFD